MNQTIDCGVDFVVFRMFQLMNERRNLFANIQPKGRRIAELTASIRIDRDE